MKTKFGGKHLTLSLLAAAAFVGLMLFYFIIIKSFSSEKFSVNIRPNTQYTEVESQLKAHASTPSMTFFSLLNGIFNYKEHVKVGHYEAKKGISVWTLFNNMRKGRQTPVRLTFNNIRTKEQLAGRFAQQLMVDSITIINEFNNPDTCAKYGFNIETIPAMFIPDTYEMYWDISLSKFMKRMKSEYDDFWTSKRKAEAKEVGLTPVEISTLASIVEEESNNKEERPAIAGLYLNRYRIGMPLQADPTVKFAVNDFSLKRILFEHLKVNSPYNTYKNIGLPPGPIRVPSKLGIDAVLHYQKHEYLYMCAKSDFSGRHAFARTMEEHHKNAQLYRDELNKRKIK
ncbi:MAG: endolytic transglycosylase MltG [Bacteroidota bacterium]|nr:endolytic transglycosylase MltG [Bacteroidota bacterium]